MSYVYAALSWFFGVVLLLVGLVGMTDEPLAGLLPVLMSAFLLPPVRNFVYSKTGWKLSVRARGAILIVLLLSVSIVSGLGDKARKNRAAAKETKLRAEKIAIEKQKGLDYFNANSQQVLAEVKVALGSKKYQEAVTLSSKYLASNNAELTALNATAKAQLAEIQKVERTKQLLSELKTAPADNIEQNKSIYQQLAGMYPDNQQYRSKLKFYSDKVTAKQKRQQLTAARKIEFEKLFSTWDGSLISLERVIKSSMNNPDSYKHVSTTYMDAGEYFIVQTTFRGTNAFGAVVTNSVRAKVTDEGQVFQIME